MENFQLWSCAWILLTAFIWGCTNPFLRKGAQGIENVGKKSEDCDNQSRVSSKEPIDTVKRKLNDISAELEWCLCNWRLTVPFLVNQSGSVLFFYSLSRLDLSLVVPITNSLTTVITALMGRLLGEEKTSHNFWSYLGMSLVCLGSGLCIFGKV